LSSDGKCEAKYIITEGQHFEEDENTEVGEKTCESVGMVSLSSQIECEVAGDLLGLPILSLKTKTLPNAYGCSWKHMHVDGKDSVKWNDDSGSKGKGAQPNKYLICSPESVNTLDCGDTNSKHCEAEYSNAKANGDLDSFYRRCLEEEGSNPLRSRCALCCELPAEEGHAANLRGSISSAVPDSQLFSRR
jgi:hypothetical protein